MLKSATINADQIRAARAYLNLSQDQLADAAGISRKSLYELEHGTPVHRSTTLAVRKTLEAHGVSFVEFDGKTGILGNVGKHLS